MGSLRTATLISAIALIFAVGQAAAFDLDQVMRDTADSFVRPAYSSFAEESKQLLAVQKQLCDNPSKANADAAKSAFAETALSWANAEIFRAGPVVEDNRLERVLFYPDRKGTGLKQVQAALAASDETVTDATELAGKSVAMQGLGTLEFVLFGTGSEALETTDGNYRCRFGAAIAGNLGTIAGTLTQAWAPGGQVDLDWNSHSETNPFARNDREALNLVLGTIIHGLEQLQDIRIGAFLDMKENKDKPKSALYWRSGLTVRSIAQNLQAIQAVFDQSGLDGALPEDQKHVAESIRFDFNAALDALQTLDKPVEAILANQKDREKLVFARNTIADLIHRFDQDFAVASGLAAGFSFSDGD